MRTCYLKESLQRDPNLASFAYSYAPPYLHRDWPEVRALPAPCTAARPLHRTHAACMPLKAAHAP